MPVYYLMLSREQGSGYEGGVGGIMQKRESEREASWAGNLKKKKKKNGKPWLVKNTFFSREIGFCRDSFFFLYRESLLGSAAGYPFYRLIGIPNKTNNPGIDRGSPPTERRRSRKNTALGINQGCMQAGSEEVPEVPSRGSRTDNVFWFGY